MTRATRDTWLDAGLRLLQKSGVDQVRIDTLCERLNVTKGSFYHHFQNHEAYLENLLTHWEERYTSRLIDEAEHGKTPSEKLERLTQQVLSASDDPEVNIRAWALTHAEARDTVRRVDKRRLDYLQQLHVELGVPAQQAVTVARAIYTTLIGSQYIVPPLNRDDLIELFAHIGGQLPPSPDAT